MNDIQIMCAYTKLVNISDVIKNPRNPNTHPVNQIKLLAKLIKVQGFRKAITVSTRSGFVVSGHGRLEAAKYLCMDEVPVDYQDYENEALEWSDMIADNKVAEFAEFDENIFKSILAEMKTDFDFSLFGCSDNKINSLTNEIGNEKINEDNIDINSEIEIARSSPRVSTGELWQLGQHRLLCGDSTKLVDVNQLMNGNLADMVFTDPPYNIDYTGKTKDKLKIQNDKMNKEIFKLFLDSVMKCCFESLKPGGSIYVCHADSAGMDFRFAFVKSGFLLKQCLIWIKNNFVLGRQDYQWRHEPILYGYKPGAAHDFFGGRKQSTVIYDLPIIIEKTQNGDKLYLNSGKQDITITSSSYQIEDNCDNSTIWRIDKPNKSELHPTMKPILLCAKAILNSTKNNGIVLDLFGGSGSTLIAAEQTKRKCYMMEVDNIYCTVILNRYEKITGIKAIKL